MSTGTLYKGSHGRMETKREYIEKSLNERGSLALNLDGASPLQQNLCRQIIFEFEGKQERAFVWQCNLCDFKKILTHMPHETPFARMVSYHYKCRCKFIKQYEKHVKSGKWSEFVGKMDKNFNVPPSFEYAFESKEFKEQFCFYGIFSKDLRTVYGEIKIANSVEYYGSTFAENEDLDQFWSKMKTHRMMGYFDENTSAPIPLLYSKINAMTSGVEAVAIVLFKRTKTQKLFNSNDECLRISYMSKEEFNKLVDSLFCVLHKVYMFYKNAIPVSAFEANQNAACDGILKSALTNVEKIIDQEISVFQPVKGMALTSDRYNVINNDPKAKELMSKLTERMMQLDLDKQTQSGKTSKNVKIAKHPKL